MLRSAVGDRSLLVSAGEASGDLMAAMALEALGSSVRSFGMGGSACHSRNMDVIVPLSGMPTMGWLPVARQALLIRRAFFALLRACKRHRPATALLVGFTTFNRVLGKRLRGLGTRVVWCAAPQVWAWRPSRLQSLRSSADTLAVIFPFEVPLWREHGYDTHYVGHPAVELTRWRSESNSFNSLAVLAGSRDQEVRVTAKPFLLTAQAWSRQTGGSVSCVVSPSLSFSAEKWLRRLARRHSIDCELADPVFGAASGLHKYDAVLCASGTASLESAISGVPPVVGYRCDWFTAIVARKLLRTEYIALPNILLKAQAFPELVQEALCPEKLTSALRNLRQTYPTARRACSRVREQLLLNDGLSFGERLATLIT